MTEIPIIEKRNTDILIYPKCINNKKIAKNSIENRCFIGLNFEIPKYQKIYQKRRVSFIISKK